MRKDSEVFYQLSYNKTKIIEIGLIAILIALGANILSVFIFKQIPLYWSLCIGIVFILIGIFLLFYIKVEGLMHSYKFKGFLLRDKEKDQFIKVDNYSLSEDFNRIFNSVLSEDKILKKQWSEDNLDNFFQVKDNKAVGNKSLKSYRLVEEILDYITLKTISITLLTFYDNSNSNNLVELNREDIPKILLDNRVLELLSKIPEDRDFDNTEISKNTFFSSEIRYERDEGGNPKSEIRTYEKFNLILPKNCTIKKDKNDYIVLESRYFKIRIKLFYSTFTTFVPTDFKKYYLGLESNSQIDVPMIICDINMKLKLWSLFSYRGWKNYQWIDNLIQSLRENIDKKHFMNKINWSTALFLIKVFK